MSCPKCGSDDWKLAQLVYKEGLTHVQTNSNGVGIGISGGGVGLGVGAAKTSGINQSDLSVSASPPEDPTEVIGVTIILLCGILGFLYGWIIKDSFILGLLYWFMVAVTLAIPVMILVLVFFPNTEYKAQMKLWEKTRMCTRCGFFYTPKEYSDSGEYDYAKLLEKYRQESVSLNINKSTTPKAGLIWGFAGVVALLAVAGAVLWQEKRSGSSDHASPNERYRFVGKDQDIVEDTRTKLQWQRCSLGQTWTGATCAGEARKYKGDEARRIAPAGWRLPTKDELASLVYCSSGKPAYWNPSSEECEGVYAKPTIWSAAFPNTPASWFWSSSPDADYASSAWDVSFGYGSVSYNYAKINAKYVRLVRGGQ